MRFTLTEEQQAFADSLDELLAGSDTVKVARAWAAADHEPGLALWRRLADLGVHALVVPEEAGGLGASPVELCVAFEALGRYAVPGPWAESVAYLATSVSGEALAELAGGAIGTVAVPPHVLYALDADVADQVWLAAADGLRPANVGQERQSVDTTRHLFEVDSTVPSETVADDRSFDLAVLATAAQLLGAGERVLADSIAYAKQRRQFGREIGSYQAIKHQLADVQIALDFARPLVFGAALTLGSTGGLETGLVPRPSSTSERDVSAAKVAAGDAAYLASRVALQVHGAVGYTRELDLSLWLLRIRALVTAWGTPAYHRGRVLDALLAGDRS